MSVQGASPSPGRRGAGEPSPDGAPDPSRLTLDPSLFRVEGHEPSSVYHYYAPEGRSYAVSRHEAGTLDPERKVFRQWRHDGGRWARGLNGEKLPLWRSLELAEAIRAGKVIVPVEGEKCVLKLIEFGAEKSGKYFFTTHSGGSNAFGPHHADELEGARLVPWPDRDEGGDCHKCSVLQLCMERVQELRLVDIDRLPDGVNDAADFVGLRGTSLGDVLALLDAALLIDDEGYEWPHPVPLYSAGASFPLDPHSCLPAELADLAEQKSEDFGIDVCLFVAMLYGVVAAAASNGWSVRASKTHVETNLARFVVGILDPGARKTAAARPLFRPFVTWIESEFAKELKAEHMTDLARQTAAKKAINKKLAELLDEKNAEKRKQLEVEIAQLAVERDRPVAPDPKFVTDDATSQAATLCLARSGGALAVLSSEGREFAANTLGAYRKDCRTDDPLLLRLHGGDPVDRERVSRESAYVPHPGGAVVVLLQTDVFGDMASSKSLRGGGFVDRVHWVRPRCMVGERETPDGDLEFDDDHRHGGEQWRYRWIDERLVALIRARFEHVRCADRPRELKLERSVRLEARDWAADIERRQAASGDLADDKGRASKLYGEALRGAALLHLIMHKDPERAHEDPIPAQYWRYSARYCEWSLNESRRALNGTNSGEFAAWAVSLYRYLERHGKAFGPYAAREVAGWGLQSVSDVQGVTERLEWMERQGWARKKSPEGRQRADRWVFRPEPPSAGL